MSHDHLSIMTPLCCLLLKLMLLSMMTADDNDDGENGDGNVGFVMITHMHYDRKKKTNAIL